MATKVSDFYYNAYTFSDHSSVLISLALSTMTVNILSQKSKQIHLEVPSQCIHKFTLLQ